MYFCVASTTEQIVQGRPDRIRMTMFPDDGMDVPSTQMMRNQPTNLQRLSQPAQILKAIVSGLATYQVRIIIVSRTVWTRDVTCYVCLMQVDVTWSKTCTNPWGVQVLTISIHPTTAREF